MRSILLLLLPYLTPLIAADACVAGGPSPLVSAVGSCCSSVSGTWYQFYAVQAICVFDHSKAGRYDGCVEAIPGQLDTRCIPGDGGLGPGSGGNQTANVTVTAGSSQTGSRA